MPGDVAMSRKVHQKVVRKPTFTDEEIRCIADMIVRTPWIPDVFTKEYGSIAKKVRVYLGDPK
jgi:hypothetical protein